MRCEFSNQRLKLDTLIRIKDRDAGQYKSVTAMFRGLVVPRIFGHAFLYKLANAVQPRTDSTGARKRTRTKAASKRVSARTARRSLSA